MNINRMDQIIEKDIINNFSEDNRLNFSDINVTVRDKVVTLSRYAFTSQAKTAAHLDALKLSDVSKVIDKIKMRIHFLTYLMIINIGLLSYACTEGDHEYSPEVIVTITVKNKITVNGDTISIDNLEAKLKEIGVTNKTNIRIMPDPEAGAGTIEEVQRKVRIIKQSQQKMNLEKQDTDR